jgi:hypothetical protein
VTRDGIEGASDDPQRRGVDRQPETAEHTTPEAPGDDPGAGARDRLAGRDAADEQPRSLLDRAFPGGSADDSETAASPMDREHGPPEPVGGAESAAALERVRETHPSVARGRLMTLGLGAVRDGNWDAVDETVAALGDHGPGAQDQLRAEAVHAALEQGQPHTARRYAEDLTRDWSRELWLDRVDHVEALRGRQEPARPSVDTDRPPDDQRR